MALPGSSHLTALTSHFQLYIIVQDRPSIYCESTFSCGKPTFGWPGIPRDSWSEHSPLKGGAAGRSGWTKLGGARLPDDREQYPLIVI
jgi:hypothetical protein